MSVHVEYELHHKRPTGDEWELGLRTVDRQEAEDAMAGVVDGRTRQARVVEVKTTRSVIARARYMGATDEEIVRSVKEMK